MPSFDVVSEVNVQEVDNAVNQAQKEIQARYDFKGTKFDLSFDTKSTEIKLNADADSRLDAMLDILNSKLIKRGIELGAIDIGKREAAGGMMMRQTLKVKQGLEQDKAKQIIKVIKDSKLKVEAQIQDKQVRVSGKKIDDLQEVVVIGSQIKGRITEAVPVTLITEADLQSIGAVSGDDLFRSIPQFADTNFNTSNSAQTTNAARGDVGSADLRTLGIGNTLVLINGRRTVNHPTSQALTNTNSVPVLVGALS